MEFVTSRAMVAVCGALLMASLAVPVGHMLSADGDNAYDRVAENIAELVDGFYDSELDCIHLSGATLLPGPGSSVVAEGYILVLSDPGGREHRAAMSHPGSFTLDYGETKTLVRIGEGIGVRTSPRSCGARPRNGRCRIRRCTGTRTPSRYRGSRGNPGRNGRSASPSGS